jgi:transitional endoplasmic reticulum ATPase
MTSIDEIGQVIKYAAQLEKLLDDKFSSELESKRIAGTLKGLGDKVKALESHLPDMVRKDLWVIVKIRNNVAHEGSLGNDSLSNYVGRCEKVITALQSIEQSSDNSAWTGSSPHRDGAGVSFIKNNPQMLVINVLSAVVIVIVVIYFLKLFGIKVDIVPVLMVITVVIGGALAAWYFMKMMFRIIHNYIADRAIWFAIISLLIALVFYSASNTVAHDAKLESVIWTWFAVSMVVFVYSIRLLLKKIGLFNSRPTRTETTANYNGNLDLATYAPRKPSYTFRDVQGMSALKTQLLAAVEDNKTSGKNGILLSGDPGNGKTMIAEALAGELKWGFMPITIGDIESRWQGQGTEQLQAVFEAAAGNSPLVLFFDECDSMLRSRDKLMNGTNQEDLKKANTFLTGIVDIRRTKKTIVIAASNYPDQLDAAATRDGRFDFKINIPNPDKEAREGLLNKFTQGLAFEEKVLERLVRRWEGFSVARIRSVAEKITKNANAQGMKEISMQKAMAALREIQGSMGGMVSEDTPTLRDGKLHFDQKQREGLLTLAMRMENIDEVERLGGQVPKGVLFYGPPGTGKTAVAKSLAKTSGWAFLATSGNELLNDNDAFSKLLKKARDLRPCIIFMDEADDVLGDRATNRYGTTVTNRILAEMDGVEQLHDVMFIAATNHPDKLDAAVIRGGRFGEHYEFKKPEDNTVLAMVQEWIHAKRDTTPFHDEFTPEAVAEVLHGLSPSDIKDRMQQAVNTGVGRILSKEGAEQIMLSDLHAVMSS